MGAHNYNPRYGLAGNQIRNLRNRWKQANLADGTWSGFDDFVKWSSENGYRDNARLGRFNDTVPHGPDNSFWYMPETYLKNPTPLPKSPPKKPAEKPPVRDLCESCTRECRSHENGCVEWYENFKKYWDAHIHRKVEIPKVPECSSKGREQFQYEHPDLAREGIEWTGS